MPDDSKVVLCTELYFHTFEPGVSKKLSAPVAWDYLLMKNMIDLLTFWIDVNYQKVDSSISGFDPAVLEELRHVFVHLKISDDMIDAVHKSSAANIVKELVLNHLARFVWLSLSNILNIRCNVSQFSDSESSPPTNL